MEAGLEGARLEAGRPVRELTQSSRGDVSVKQGDGRRDGDERTDLSNI